MRFAIFLLFITPLLSGLLPYQLTKQGNKGYAELFLTFSGSYLFSITFVHLLPELFASGDHNLGRYLLAGFALQLFLDFLSQGLAHGHKHTTQAAYSTSTNLLPLLALCLHALLDGLFLATNHEAMANHLHHYSSFIGGVLLHKIPVAFALATWLIHTLHTRTVVVAYLILFSLATPIGWAATYHLQHSTLFGVHTMHTLSAFATGSLLHIAITIVAEKHTSDGMDRQKLTASLLGMLLALGVEIVH